jgi:urease accessory protein
VFSGDDLRQSIRVESGAQVLLSSQAALQVHAGVRGCDAQVRQRYDVEADGELHCRWDPVIPFAGARFSQDIDLQLAASSRLYWSDALMSGRVGCGESWASATLSHHLRLSVDDRLTYLERYRLDPPRPRAVQPWLAASASFFGTALIYHPAVIDDSAEPLQRALNQLTDVRAGVDLADTHLIVGRIAAWRGETFRVARTMTREWAAAQVFADPALRFRR